MNPTATFGDYIGYYWDPGAEEWVEMLPGRPSRALHDGPQHQAPLHGPVHGRHRAGALQGHLLQRDLHQPEVEQHHRPYRHRRPSTPGSRLLLELLDQSFTVYERTEETLEIPRLPHHQHQEGPATPGSSWIPTGSTGASSSSSTSASPTAGSSWPPTSTARPRERSTTASPTTSATAAASYDPNFWINAEGTLTNDPTHMIKIQGTYVLPFDINFNVYFRGITGNAWTTRVPDVAVQPGPGHVLRRAARRQPLRHGQDPRPQAGEDLHHRQEVPPRASWSTSSTSSTTTPITSWGTPRSGTTGRRRATTPRRDGHELYGIVRPAAGPVGLRLIF